MSHDTTIHADLIAQVQSLRMTLGYEWIHDRVLIDSAISIGLNKLLRELREEQAWQGALNRHQAGLAA